MNARRNYSFCPKKKVANNKCLHVQRGVRVRGDRLAVPAAAQQGPRPPDVRRGDGQAAQGRAEGSPRPAPRPEAEDKARPQGQGLHQGARGRLGREARPRRRYDEGPPHQSQTAHREGICNRNDSISLKPYI